MADWCRDAGIAFDQNIAIPMAQSAGMSPDAVRRMIAGVAEAAKETGREASLLPDVRVKGKLGDVKTFASMKGYCAVLLDGGFPKDMPPVERRAERVNPDYLAKAHKGDVTTAQSRTFAAGLWRVCSWLRGRSRGTSSGPSARCRRMSRVWECAARIGERLVREGELEVAEDQDPAEVVLPEVRRAWGIANVKRRAQCLLQGLSQSVQGASRFDANRRAARLDDIVQRINVGRVIKGDKYGRHHSDFTGFRPPVRGLPNYNSAGLGGPGGRDASV